MITAIIKIETIIISLSLQEYRDPYLRLIMNENIGPNAFIWSPSAMKDIREHVSN